MIFYVLTSAVPWGRCWNLSLNICLVPREVLKPEPERRGFQHLPTGPADVNASEKHVWSLLLRKTFFFRSKASGKVLQKVITCTYNDAVKHITYVPFENAASRAKTAIATVHFTDDVSFYDGRGMLIHKIAKLCINSMWLALLIHGFVLVKTWLLIACDTAFHAVIIFMNSF